MKKVFKRYAFIMRPLILVGIVSGFIPLILIPGLIIYEHRDDYIDGLIECFKYVYKGAK